MMTMLPKLLAATLILAGTAAHADFSKVEREEEFLSIVAGKDLRRPLVNVQVTENGDITGNGAGWAVSGSWTWEDGYFCRDLYWGGDPLGYNCQQVDVQKDGRIRFTSDRGAGDSAEFRLR
jgi:hypothetical protein